jgi:hypothetical protein
VLGVLGVGVLIFCAAYALSSAIPYHWMDVDEDGEETFPTHVIAQWMITLFGTAILMDYVEKQALSGLAEDMYREEAQVVESKSLADRSPDDPN